jgi:hypothetical protein
MVYTPQDVQANEGFMSNKELEKQVYDSYSKAVIRLLVKIRTPKIGILIDELNGSKKIRVKDAKQTWDHLVLFESDLTPAVPLKTRYKVENYQEWLGDIIRQIQGGEVDDLRPRQLYAR